MTSARVILGLRISLENEISYQFIVARYKSIINTALYRQGITLLFRNRYLYDLHFDLFENDASTLLCR